MFLKQKKKNKLTLSAKLSNATQLPFDMAMPRPYIKMCHNREAIIEDAGKLLHYDKECIKVKQQRDTVIIEGKELKIVCLANGDLRVVGYVSGVSFE